MSTIMSIILAAGIVGVIGLCIGLILGLADKKFKVEVDEREVLVRSMLPGNNCGGCGYPGCDGLAAAIVSGKAPVNACPVGGAPVAEEIAGVMGVEAESGEKKTAFVKCAGTCEKTKRWYNYYGITDCRQAAMLAGKGEKACDYGCLGYGSCVSACKFDAIHVIDGIALVDQEKCVACGACAAACPKHLIELVPVKAKHLVQCNSNYKGKDVKSICSAGCIGCGICAKQCEFGAITLENNLAHIDYDKCTNCGKCAEKCPVKIIK